MRRLLQSLRLRAHPELSRLISMAWAVHRHRVRQPKYRESGQSLASEVSRSSILYASTILRPRIRDLFEESGLDFGLWRQDLEASDFQSEPSTPAREDIDVEEQHFSAAMKRYSEVFPGRSVDIYAVVFGLLATAQEGAGAEGAYYAKRLRDAGMRIGEAAGLLFEEMKPDTGLVNTVELSRFELSEGADAVVRKAKHRAAGFERDIPLTASFLFITLAEAGADPSDTGPASFLRRSLDRAQPGRFGEIVEKYLSWYGPTAGSSDRLEPEVTTAYVMAIFKTAQGLARHTTRKSRIHRRHLVGALLTTIPGEGAETGAYTLLRTFGLDPKELPGAFLSSLRDLPPDTGDDMDAWELHLSPGQRPPSAARVPLIDSEVLAGPDLLRIKQDVEAFATLIAANSFEPPLSIGLFGDWGSGKSFFMQKLWDRVEKLAVLAENHRGSGRPPVSHRRIVQIKFNAWHYAEVNLWASLVTHIFQELRRASSPQDGDDQKWNQTLKKLEEATGLQANARTMLMQAVSGLQSARDVRSKQKLELDQALKAAWNVVVENLKPGQRKELETTLSTEMLGQLREDLLLRREEAQQLQEQLRSSILIRALRNGKSVGSFVLVLAIVIVLSGLVLWLRGNAAMEDLTARLTVIGAFIAGVSSWLGLAIKKTSSILASMKKIETAAQEQLEESHAAKTLLQAEQAFVAAQSELAQRQREVEEIHAEIQELRPGQRLSRFLEERAASSDYRKHLGLPALVRRDFEELEKLMRVETSVHRRDVEEKLERGDARGLAKAVLSEVLLDTDKAMLKVIAEGLFWDLEITDENDKKKSTIELQARAEELVCRTFDEGLPRIDRIILYIDDLDRCPPKQVVKVLQAIHLLLAIPLFVVVVGVDARWISRSLRLHYRDLWRHVDREEGGEEIAGATPLDYLEKIFQIPFWLEPLSPEVTREYLDGLIAKSLAPAASGSPPPPLEPPKKPVVVLSGKGNEAPQGAEGDPPPDQEATGGAPSAGKQAPPPMAPPPPPPAEPAAEPSPELLVIQGFEREFMLYLAPLVGRSPRAVKRFLNVYRVFRASLDPGRLSGFFGTQDSPGDFREALVLLGLICGSPELAPEFLRCLSFVSNGDTLEAALEEIAASEDKEAFARLRTRKEWTAVERHLRQLNGRLARENQPPLSLPFLQDNARSAIRYSFDWERL